MKKFLMFLLLTAAMFGLKAQNSLWLESHDMLWKNSIVRSDGNDIILYGESSSTQGYFSLIPYGGGQTYTASLLSGTKVKDFRVDNGCVYFVGEGLGRTFVGEFKINDVFFGGGQIRYHLLPLTGSSLTVNALNRLKLYRDDSGMLHFLVVGESIMSGPGISITLGCLVETDENFTTYRLLTGENEDFFDDVVINDNTIVTIARKGNNMEHGAPLIRVFDRHAPVLFASATSHVFTLEHLAASSRYRATHISGDDFAISYAWKDLNNDLNTSVDVMSATLSPTISFLYGYRMNHGTGSTPYWRVIDMVYNQPSRTLSLLEDASGASLMPGLPHSSAIHEFDISAPAAITGRTLTGFPHDRLSSLSLHGASQNVSSGYTTKLGVYFQEPGTNSCAANFSPVVNLENWVVRSGVSGTQMINGLLNSYAFPPTITIKSTTIICEQ